MSVLELTDGNTLLKSLESNEFVVVNFYANWAEECKDMNKVFERLPSDSAFSDIVFFKCNAEDYSKIAERYEVQCVPTFVLFEKGKVSNKIRGADPGKLVESIKCLGKKETNGVKEATALEKRLKSLINSSTIMLFMKGTRDNPKCGFSRQITAILNAFGTPYETFDILEDEEVRAGLKVFSDWPTYPQLYVNGTFIGGLDIVKELNDNGELKELVKSVKTN